MPDKARPKYKQGFVAHMRYETVVTGPISEDHFGTSLVPVRVQRELDERGRLVVRKLSETGWGPTAVSDYASQDLPRPGGRPWGSCRFLGSAPTRQELIDRGVIKPAGHGIPYVALDEKGRRAAAADYAAYVAGLPVDHPAPEECDGCPPPTSPSGVGPALAGDAIAA